LGSSRQINSELFDNTMTSGLEYCITIEYIFLRIYLTKSIYQIVMLLENNVKGDYTKKQIGSLC
jgi:hypothetical protein